MAFFPPSPPPVTALPPAIPIRARAVAQAHFTLPGETGQRGLSMEDATRLFGESIQALSAADRQQIQTIHAGVDQWAAGKQDPDKLGQFLVRVMIYADQRLDGLQANPGSVGECQGLERVFTSGFQMVEVYSALGR